MTKSHAIHKHIFHFTKEVFWFLIGIILGSFFTVSFAFILFQKIYGNSVYPGVYVNNINFGGKTQQEVAAYFDSRNDHIGSTTFTFTYNDQQVMVLAKSIHAGYNSQLIAQQAYSIGRSPYVLSNIVLVFKSYLSGIFLTPSFTYNTDLLISFLDPIAQKVAIQPVDALFTFQNGKVTTFRPSSDGQAINIYLVKSQVSARIPFLIVTDAKQSLTIPLQTMTLKPKVGTADANNLGIEELIGMGTSLFQHSIQSRIFNITLATSKLNGILVAPNEIFSFDNALGDVSKFTGYQEAYIIQNGRTILGDGGGVCQVSTTFFRAILHAGLPIVERHAHDYRVGYYEEDSPPGFDATVYVPSVDLKFKNDTGHYILIQTYIDPATLRLTFYLYGTSDGRQTSISDPVISNESPAPEASYQDDPTLPLGVIKQVDFAANGARVSFTRMVTRNGQTILQDTFVSNYQPWRAVFLRGTKQ